MLADFFNFLLPKNCIICYKEGGDFCKECKNKLVKLEQDVFTEDIKSCFLYKYPASKIVKDLKYNNSYHNAGVVADLIYENCKADLEEADFIIPIPTSLLSRLKKNYSPPALIVNALCKKVKADNLKFAFKRVGHQSQVGLSKQERLHNMQNAFKLKNTNLCIKNKNVIIIDDTITTGATILSFLKEVEKLKPKQIKTICFAYTPHHLYQN